ncbi:MAG: hypothetical protein WD887_02360 [Candidatus Saccharimonadales bacterium]
MSELPHYGSSPAPASHEAQSFDRGAYWADRYSQELQLERGNEGEGSLGVVESYIHDRVFEDLEAATNLYSALTASPDRFVRLKSIESLDRLWRSPYRADARSMLRRLMEDSDPEVQRSALDFANIYW